MAKTPRKRIAKKYLIELDKENTLNNNNRISNLKENIQNAEKKLLEIKNNQEIASLIGQLEQLTLELRELKLERSSEDIHKATDLWRDDQAAALEKYGHISWISFVYLSE